MELFGFTLSKFMTFFLVLSRCAGLFSMAPVFGSPLVPVQAKVGIAVLVSFLLLPVVGPVASSSQPTLWVFAASVVREALVGLCIGYAASLLFVAAQLAGELVDIQIGFGIATVFNPMTSSPVSLVAQFQYLLALTIFLAIDGHHFLLLAVAQSFRTVPLATAAGGPQVMAGVSRMFADIAVIALRLGAPVIATLFMTDLVLGIMARVLPQMNVFVVGLPLKIGAGMATLVVAIPVFVLTMSGLLRQMGREVGMLATAFR